MNERVQSRWISTLPSYTGRLKTIINIEWGIQITKARHFNLEMLLRGKLGKQNSLIQITSERIKLTEII